jgi:hypothetical protein
MDPNTPPTGSLIVAWNNIYLDTVRHIGGAPGPLARIGALLHLAMYEATNRLVPGSPYPSILKNVAIPVPTGATAKASAAYAASFTLQAAVETYVTSTLAAQGGTPNPFDPFQLRPGAMAHMAVLKEQDSKEASGNKANVSADSTSKTFGEAVATEVLKAFLDSSGLDPAVKPDLAQKPGEWRDTGSGAALTPQWGTVPLYLVSVPTTHYLPTVLGSLSTYTDLLHSPVYAAQMAETKLLGAAHTTARTAEETEIAFFWANDLNGTSKPPGQLYTIVQAVAKQQGTLVDKGDGKGANSGQLQTARLFAMVGTAMVNASIVAWQAKYYWPTKDAPVRLWRPETAIQLATQDGNPSTAADPAWQPLSAMTSGGRFSPNFPAFVSGHSTFGAAFAAAMQAFYGTDAIPFTATTEDPHAVKDENGIRRTRSFTSFTQAAIENGRSRIYLGVHYQFDANGGFEIGTAVGKETAQYFQKLTAHIGGLTMMSVRADITAIEDSNLVWLRNNDEPLWLDLTVSTYCQWSFTLDPGVDEHQPPEGDANRQLQYAQPGVLLAQRVASWTLIITNQTKQTQEYEGLVRLVQGASIATGNEVYRHPITLQQLPPTTEDPATPPAIIGRTLTFYAV